MAQVAALGKGTLKAAAESASSAISHQVRTQAQTLASSNTAGSAAIALGNGATGLLKDAMGKAAAAQQALEGVVDEVGTCICGQSAIHGLMEES